MSTFSQFIFLSFELSLLLPFKSLERVRPLEQRLQNHQNVVDDLFSLLFLCSEHLFLCRNRHVGLISAATAMPGLVLYVPPPLDEHPGEPHGQGDQRGHVDAGPRSQRLSQGSSPSHLKTFNRLDAAARSSLLSAASFRSRTSPRWRKATLRRRRPPGLDLGLATSARPVPQQQNEALQRLDVELVIFNEVLFGIQSFRWLSFLEYNLSKLTARVVSERLNMTSWLTRSRV